MKPKNIVYNDQQMADFFETHRISWMQFYPSERALIETLGIQPNSCILDVGCACGGLGGALRERYGITKYCGIDLHSGSIARGKTLFPDFTLIEGDFLNEHVSQQVPFVPDFVFSLSCVDWNIEYEEMLAKIWELVPAGASLVISTRLTKEKTLSRIEESFQWIRFTSSTEKGTPPTSSQKAPYIVVNVDEFFERITGWKTDKISSVGYYGTPSDTAVSPISQVCFAVFSIRKSSVNRVEEIIDLDLDLPSDLLEQTTCADGK